MLLNTNNERNDAGRGRGRGRGRGAGRNRGNRGRGGARGDGNSASFSNVTVNEVRGDQSSRGRGNGFRAGMSPRAQRGNLETNRERVVNRADEFARLENLLNQTESNIFQFLTQLGSGDFGFGLLLNKNNPTPKQTRTVLNVLIKVANSEVMAEKRMRILLSSADSVFITSSLPQYFASYEYELTEEQFVKKTFEDAAVLAEKLFEICPTKALASLAVYLKTWIATVPISLKNGAFHRRVLALQQECATLKQKYEHLPPPIRDKEILRDFENQRPPPNDYRGLTVYPSYDDLKISAEESFIRSNIIKGPYKDGTHYLDVQFRLIKEDFVKPLRDGIRQYVSAVMNNSLKSLKNLDIKLYQNVKLMTPEMSMRSGIIYVIDFDMSELWKVNWITTKRLMFGSLVCLTSDNFQSMIVATVVDTAAISSGRISVKLLRSSTDRFTPDTEYIMAESPSYYETCRHVLNGLQVLKPLKIPMKKHIVHVEETVGYPDYSNENSAWDFSPLLKDANDKRQFQRVTNHGPFPTPEQVGLDSAQHQALIMTLFRKLSIIQGPPGTGKTFIGYKIVQMLLHNKSLWYHNSPILVVCYTNHALDQFLEGILDTGITDKLVRIGGQSKCEALKKYNLVVHRSSASKSKSTPQCMRVDNAVLTGKLKNLEEAFGEMTKSLSRLTSSLIHETKLQEFIWSPHFNQLLYHDEHKSLSRNSSVLYPWLLNESVPESENQIVENKKTDNENLTFDNEIEEEDADLVKAELNRRLLDGAEGGWNTHKRTNEWKTNGTQKFGSWLKSQPEYKSFMRLLHTETKDLNDFMTDYQMYQIRDVWKLSSKDRWKLYRTWLKRFRDAELKKFEKEEEEFSSKFKELQELHEKMDSVLLEDMDVIGMTTTGAAKFHRVIEFVKPRIVIVEEAAEIMEAQIISALPTTTQHLILIGDHKQLRPNPTVYDLARKHHLDISLFERMINNNVKSEQLVKQHRMSPRIRRLLTPHIYSELVDDVSVLQYPKTTGMEKSIYFLNHNAPESGMIDTKSRKNVFESAFVTQLCSYLLKQNQYDYSRITVLTTYLGQLFQIKKDMNASELTRKVRCTVVDNFQGEENDVIILSLVRSNADENVGFLKIDNRICVALSRAKHCLYVIGNMSILEKQERSVWPKIIQDLKKDELIGDTLTLSCGNHDTKTVVSNPDDFSLFPDGGCRLPCETRMPCGHQCRKKCHQDDPEHIEVSKLCTVVSNKKCNQRLHDYALSCNKRVICRLPVETVYPYCKHANMVPCDDHSSPPPCAHACPKVMPCGHPCTRKCHNDDSQHIEGYKQCIVLTDKTCGRKLHSHMIRCNKTVYCKVLVETLYSSCGHTNMVPCADYLMPPPCAHPCPKIMPCGHECMKNCHANDAEHTVTMNQCKVICSKTCNRKLHTRDLPCNNRRCSLPVETVYPSCGHTNMVACDDYLMPPRCEHPCSKTLPCGHPCRRKCHANDPCGNQSCSVLVETVYPSCGHPNMVPCKDRLRPPSCSQPCSKGMKCGHQCSRICHSMDPEHATIYKTCRVTCEKLCDRQLHTHSVPCNHRVICHRPVDTLYPSCGHNNAVDCDNYLLPPPCQNPCLKVMPCGHICKLKCHSGDPDHIQLAARCEKYCWKTCERGLHKFRAPCKVKCFALIQVDYPDCGHANLVPCGLSEQPPCVQQCSQVLKCGHRCPRICHADDPGHIENSKKCNVICTKMCDRKAHIHHDVLCSEPVICRKPGCGNDLVVPFPDDPLKLPRRDVLCLKLMKCGHRCHKKSHSDDPEHEKLVTQCQNIVRVVYPSCGHGNYLPCSKSKDPMSLALPCSKRLSCGHRCGRKCTCSNKIQPPK